MAKLTLTYENIYTYVSNFLGLTTTGTAPTGTDLTTCQNIVARGLRQFLYPVDERSGKLHNWSFIRKFATITINSHNWKYALPIDFSEVDGMIHYESDESQPPLKKRDADYILNMRSDGSLSSWPDVYAIVPSTYDIETGSSYELWLYPTPDQQYVLNFFYRFDPLKPSVAADLVVGGIRATEAILESCLAVAEQQEDEVAGLHTQLARKLIQELIIADGITVTNKIGNLYRDRDDEWPPTRSYLVAYKDANIYP